MKRLSAQLLHPDQRDVEDEGAQPSGADSINVDPDDGIPREGCIATEDGRNVHLDALCLTPTLPLEAPILRVSPSVTDATPEMSAPDRPGDCESDVDFSDKAISIRRRAWG